MYYYYMYIERNHQRNYLRYSRNYVFPKTMTMTMTMTTLLLNTSRTLENIRSTVVSRWSQKVMLGWGGGGRIVY